MKEIHLHQQEFNFHFEDICMYVCMYDLQLTYFQWHLMFLDVKMF